MTVAEIQKLADEQTAIHATAKQIVELLDKLVADVKKLGGDEEAARERVIELVTE